MEYLRKYANETQGKNSKHQELICKMIIDEFEKITGTNFFENIPKEINLTYLNRITTLLLIPDYSRYRKVLIKLLDKYKVNERGLLLHILGVINQIKIGYPEEEANERRCELIKSFSTLPYFDIISLNEKYLNIKTKYGNVKVYKYDSFVEDTRIKMLLRTVPFANYCHHNVEVMKCFYINDYITTSELSLLFGGSMYHSYFTTKQGVVDITNNMFFEEDSFNIAFAPTEILKIRSRDLTRRYEEFLIEENLEDDNLAPVLVLALNNKIKGIKEKY